MALLKHFVLHCNILNLIIKIKYTSMFEIRRHLFGKQLMFY